MPSKLQHWDERDGAQQDGWVGSQDEAHLLKDEPGEEVLCGWESEND